MKNMLVPPAPDKNEELVELISRLHATVQRLQELTDGEVDAVLDPSGHSFLLGRAQVQLQQSDERFRSLFAAAATGIAISTPQGVFLQANAAYCQMLGYTEDELRALNFASLTHPEDLTRNVELRDQLLAGERENFVMEKRYLKKDGATVWTRHSVAAVRSPAGDATMLIVIAEDITERKQIQDALQRQQSELQALFDLMPAMIWFKDTHNGIVRINQRAAEATGRPITEIEGKSMLEIYPQDAAKYYADDLTVIHSGASKLGIVEMLRTREGREFWVQTDKVPVSDKTGKVIGIVVMAQDITARKQTEETSRESEALLRIAGQTARLGGWRVELPGAHVVWSDVVCTIHEVSAGTRPGLEDAINYYAPECRELIRAAFGTCVRDGTPFDVETELITAKKNRVWVRAIGEAVHDSSGAVIRVQGSFQDINERKSLEQQFRQSQKMDAIGQLAGGVAHDFNNLLSVILGYSDILLQTLSAEHPNRKPLEEIKKAGELSATLTRQLLAFSRKQVLAPRILDLNVIVSDTEKMLQRVIGEDIDLVAVLSPQLDSVRADPGQIEQVLLNLAVNARDAMPAGGKLTIETKNVELDESYVKNHPGVRPGPYVMLAVSDSGGGMTDEVKRRIFEPFFTTKGLGKGTGLGLAVIHGVVKQSEGLIEVYSELGLGTSFKIYLPRVDPAGLSASLLQSLETESPRGTETVLLVEDQPALREMIRLVLEEIGYTVLEAAHGDDAWQAASRHQDQIHLLITDVVLPGIGGPAVAELLLSLHPKMKVLYMSGYTDDAVVRRGILQEHVDFLQKPFSSLALAHKVREVINH